MLEAINAERARAGRDALVLGDNVAAQLHAEASLEHCFSSHWGVDGLKPYIRYSLAGGYQSNGENVHGSNYCIEESDRYFPVSSIEEEIDETMKGLMQSPGHRRAILLPSYKKVNIGLAWDRYNFKAIQHFEGDHVQYDHLPVIENGALVMSGTVKNGVTFMDEEDLGVQVFYDPPPHTLTLGQVARTYCYRSGLQIAALRPPLTGNWYYLDEVATQTYKPCLDPYRVPADAPAPRSHDEAHTFWQAAYSASQALSDVTIMLPWVTANEWTAEREAFSVRADLTNVLGEHGHGVYTIILWAPIDGEDTVISEYSIFYGVTPIAQ